MKNLKIRIILCVILGAIIFGGIYYYNFRDDDEEVLQENIYAQIEENIIQKEENIIMLHIIGEVKSPGIVEVKENSRIIDVIEAAGGLTEYADTSKINLAYAVSDGQKIYIPNINDENVNTYIYENAGDNVIVDNINLNTNNLININTATQTELETLSGIGPSTALKIIDYREKNGKFKSIEDIKNVTGIGEAKYESIKDYICAK